MFRKVISLIILFTFAVSNVSFAATSDIAPTTAKKEVITDPEKIVISRDAGLVKSKFTGNKEKLVIHIQDAHCNYEAQSNIAKILETLIKNDGLTFVSVEGADGVIDTSWFKSFPDDEVRKEVADYFMKKGEITGPEFLSITTDYPIKLFGAETRAYYIQNLNAFTSSYPLKEPTEKYLNQIKTVLNRLKNFIYNDGLKEMDLKAADYESKKLQFNDYIKFLQAMAEKHKINLRAYDNFFKLVSVLVYEKKIDFTVTDKERSALIDDLSRTMPKDTLTELVGQSVAFKSGKISSADFYSYLKKLAIAQGIDIQKTYPNLYNYIIYNSVYSRIENEKLFGDIKDLEIAIKEKLFANNDQRTLEKLSRHIDTLLGLVNIKLLNDDFDYYKAHREEFTHDTFASFIKAKTIQFGLAYDIMPPDNTVSKSMADLEDFYVIAIKRDKALVDNTIAAMNKDGQKIGVLITGGFHSEGITKLLEKSGVSYMVVCPSITKDVPTPYIQILTNQRTPLENILVAPAHAKEQTGSLAPPVRSWCLTLTDRELKQIDSGKDDLEIAIEGFENDWIRVYINGGEIGGINVEGYVEHVLTNFGGRAIDIVENFREQLVERARALDRQGREMLLSKVNAQLASLDDAKIREKIERAMISAARAKAKAQAMAPEAEESLIASIQEKFRAEITAMLTAAGAASATPSTPGTQAIGPRIGLTEEQADAIGLLIRESFKEKTYHIDKIKVKDGRTFEFIVHIGLKDRINSHNANVIATGLGVLIPSIVNVHPGRGGDVKQHKLTQAHIDISDFDNLTDAEMLIVAEHEMAHLDIFNGVGDLRIKRDAYLNQNLGSNEEDFVDSLPGCDTITSGIRAKLDFLEHIRQAKAIIASKDTAAAEKYISQDDRYGSAVKAKLASLKDQADGDGIEQFIWDTLIERYNIDLQRTALIRQPYQGYGRVMVLSSTNTAAAFKEGRLKAVFAGIHQVEVGSSAAEGFDEAGQVLGIIANLELANAKTGGRLGKQLEEGSVSLAIFPDAGLAERFGPMTQGLNDQRGWQDLLGAYPNRLGELIKAKLILSVILNSSDFALSNKARPFTDIFWTSQQVAGTIPHDQIRRSDFAYQKMLVPIDWSVPESVLLAQLWQFGTAAVGDNGEIVAFFGNQKSGAVMQNAQGELVWNPDRANVFETLKKAKWAGFDYGSLSMKNAMLLALWKYWSEKTEVTDGVEVKIIRKGLREGSIDKKWKRDIDPDFTQPLAFLLQAITNNPKMLDGVPAASLLRTYTGSERREALRKAVLHIRDALPDDVRAQMKEVVKIEREDRYGTKIKEEKKVELDSVAETIEIFLLNRDNSDIFGKSIEDLARVIGSISLGANSEWTTYRSAFDSLNDKLFALTGLDPANKVTRIDKAGNAVQSDATMQQMIAAENIRRRGNINDDMVCDFYIGDTRIILTRKQITGDKPWEYKYENGQTITVHNSIVQNCILYPGSRIANSVVEDSIGVIDAENSYVQRSTVSDLKTKNGMAHSVVDDKPVSIEGMFVVDIFRPDIGVDMPADDRFPRRGQTRLAMPMSYDPKKEDGKVLHETGNKFAAGVKDEETGNTGIRGMICDVDRNIVIENMARLNVLMANSMYEAMAAHLRAMVSEGTLTDNFVSSFIRDFNRTKPTSRQRTEMIALDNLFVRYGDKHVKAMAENHKIGLLNNNLTLGPTVDPDIYRRDSVRATADIALTNDVLKASGAAYVRTLSKIRNKPADKIRIGVGRESRTSGSRVSKAFIQGCIDAGASVIDATNGGKELTSTPIMYFASRYLDGGNIDGIVNITASHLPGDQNGLKPTCAATNFTSDEMQAWLNDTHDVIDHGLPQITKGFITSESILEPYRVLLAAALQGSEEWLALVDQVFERYADQSRGITLKEAIDRIRPKVQAYTTTKPLLGMVLAADSGFGSMGPIIGDFLTQWLSARIDDIGPVADYELSTKDANPNNPDNLNKGLVQKVKQINALLGMGFDVDGDRLGVVTLDGKILRGDDISCVIAPIVIKEAIKKAVKQGINGYRPVIVLNVLCSDRLKEAIRRAGGIPVESRVGFNSVKEVMTHQLAGHYAAQYPGQNELIPGQTAEMGVEISSHIMFKENFNSDDAFFAVLKLLGILQKEANRLKLAGQKVPDNLLDIMLNNMIVDHHTGEWRTPMIDNQARLTVARAIGDYYQGAEGARVGRFTYKVRNTLDGIKIDYVDEDGGIAGFLAVRPSGTSPEIVVSINSLVSKDVFNFIKNDFFDKVAKYKMFIKWQKKDEKTGKMVPALEPVQYYDELLGFVDKGEVLPVAAAAVASARTPGVNAISAAAAPDAGQIAPQIAVASRSINEMLNNYGRVTDKTSVRNTCYEMARKALKVADAETAVALQVMAGQTLAIMTLIDQKIPGAEKLRFTADVNEMIINEKGKSYISKQSTIDSGIGIAATEGADGLYWRGSEGIKKLGDNIVKEAIYDQEKFGEQAPKMVMYTMLHIGGYHTTVFLHDYLPGSIQHTSTGPGHLQGNKVDFKFVVTGSGIQWNKDNTNAFARHLDKGMLFTSQPYYVDSVENLGGLIFNDFSMSLPGIGSPRPATPVVPYYAFIVNGHVAFMENAGNAQPSINLITCRSNPTKTLYDLYRTGTVEELASIDGDVREDSARMVTPADIARAAQTRAIAESGKPIVFRPSEQPVFKPYAWGGTGIAHLLGLAKRQIAEIWFGSTQKDGLSKIPGIDTTLQEVIAVNPEKMLGPGLTEKPVFSKFLGKDGSQPQIVHVGFNARIKGNEEKFVQLMIEERRAIRALMEDFARLNPTKDQFERDFRIPYEKWVSDEINVGWRTLVIPEFPNWVIEALDHIRTVRADLVSYLNEVKLEPGQVIISPVGYIHSIVGSHQTHPLFDQAKNEAWYMIPDGAGGLLYYEPQQTSNTTYSPFDFPTPIVWSDSKGRPWVRKDFLNDEKEVRNLKLLLMPGELLPSDEAGVIRLIAERTMKFEAAKPDDFVITNQAKDITTSARFTAPVRAKAESLIEGAYPVWPKALFTLEKVSLNGQGASKEASITVNPVPTSYSELVVTKGEVEITVNGKQEKLNAGSSVFVPASDNTPITIKASANAEIVRLYPAAEEKQIGEEGAGRMAKAEALKLVQSEERELAATLANPLCVADPANGVVILGVDNTVYSGDANTAVSRFDGIVDANTKPGSILVVRGNGAADLASRIADASAQISARGMAVRSIVSHLDAGVAIPVNISSRLGTILTIDLNGKDLNLYYPQIIKLFELSIKIAYKFEPRDIADTLSSITGMGPTEALSAVRDLLVNGILRIIPRIMPINYEDAREIYKAVRKALTSL